MVHEEKTFRREMEVLDKASALPIDGAGFNGIMVPAIAPSLGGRAWHMMFRNVLMDGMIC